MSETEKKKKRLKTEAAAITDIIISSHKNIFHKNITNYFLVDYENVRSDGFSGIENRGKNDSICIFYSKNADKMSFDLHSVLSNTKAAVSTQRVRVGYKNALDFQLSSFLGYVISQSERKACYYIVTKDNGFNCLVDYWKKLGADVSIVKSLVTKEEVIDDLEQKVRRLLSDEEDMAFALKCIRSYDTKMEINAAMMKKYMDGKKVSQIYQVIKPLLADKS